MGLRQGTAHAHLGCHHCSWPPGHCRSTRRLILYLEHTAWGGRQVHTLAPSVPLRLCTLLPMHHPSASCLPAPAFSAFSALHLLPSLHTSYSCLPHHTSLHCLLSLPHYIFATHPTCAAASCSPCIRQTYADNALPAMPLRVTPATLPPPHTYHDSVLDLSDNGQTQCSPFACDGYLDGE